MKKTRILDSYSSVLKLWFFACPSIEPDDVCVPPNIDQQRLPAHIIRGPSIRNPQLPDFRRSDRLRS